MKNTRAEKFKTKLGNQSGIALIWTYLISVFLLTVLTGFYNFTSWNARNLTTEHSFTQAFYLAESALDKKLYDLRNGNTGTLNGTLTGVGSYQANVYTVAAGLGEPYLAVEATGTTPDGVTQRVIANVKTVESTPEGVSAALTARESIIAQGSLVVDGRDFAPGTTTHLSSGTAGVAYFGSNTIQSSVSIGGLGFAPSNPWNPLALLQMPSNEDLLTPEAVLGTTPGTLDPYTHTTAPAGPLSQELYVWEVPAGTSSVSYTLGDSTTPGTGILIVKSDNPDITVTLAGRFDGLVIITGNLKLSSAAIYGAVVMIHIGSPTVSTASCGDRCTPPTSYIRYSTQALSEMTPDPAADPYATQAPAYLNNTFNVEYWQNPNTTDLSPLLTVSV